MFSGDDGVDVDVDVDVERLVIGAQKILKSLLRP